MEGLSSTGHTRLIFIRTTIVVYCNSIDSVENLKSATYFRFSKISNFYSFEIRTFIIHTFAITPMRAWDLIMWSTEGQWPVLCLNSRQPTADSSFSISIPCYPGPHSEIKAFNVLSPSWCESSQVCLCGRRACADRLQSADRSELRTVCQDAAVSCRQMSPLKMVRSRFEQAPGSEFHPQTLLNFNDNMTDGLFLVI